MMENPHINLCPVLNPDYQGDINKIINGTLHEMKTALYTVAREYKEN